MGNAFEPSLIQAMAPRPNQRSPHCVRIVVDWLANSGMGGGKALTRRCRFSIVPRKPIENFDTDVERPHLPAIAHKTACRSCNLSAQTSRAHGPLSGLSRASRKLSGAGPIRRPAGRSGAGICRTRVPKLPQMRHSCAWLRKGKVRGLWAGFFGRVFLSRSNRMPLVQCPTQAAQTAAHLVDHVIPPVAMRQ